MSLTERCRLCREFHDTMSHPDLRGVCLLCWHFIQDYLTERNMTIIQEAGE